MLLLDRLADDRERQDYRAALICSVIANVNRDPEKTKPFTPDDFMPKVQEEQTPEQMAELFKFYALAMGGEVH